MSCSACRAGSCSADVHLTQDDLGPVLRATIYGPDGRTVQDLTGATVTLEIQRADSSGAVFGGPCTIVGLSTAGLVQYAWQLGDSAIPGLYRFKFRLMFGAVPIHWPNDRSYLLRVEPKFDAEVPPAPEIPGALAFAIPVLTDPSQAPGLALPIGSRVRLTDDSAAWDKFGEGDTDWSPVGDAVGAAVDQTARDAAAAAQASADAAQADATTAEADAAAATTDAATAQLTADAAQTTADAAAGSAATAASAAAAAQSTANSAQTSATSAAGQATTAQSAAAAAQATATAAGTAAASASADAATAAAAAAVAQSTATTAQSAAGAAQTTANSAVASVALRPLTTDLASTAAGKGLSMLGVQDAAGLITATNGEAALAELATNIAANTAAITLRPLTSDLASTAAAKGASMVGIQDAGGLIVATTIEAALAELAAVSPGVATVSIARGGTGQITANAALTALQALALSQTSLLALADNLTATAPFLFTLKHTSSGTVAAGFGGGLAADLQSAGGTLRRGMTDVTTWTTATNGAEVANRTISLMGAGTLAAVMELRPGQILASVDGTETLPSFGWVGPGGFYGFYRDTANNRVGVTRANVTIATIDFAKLTLPQPNAAIILYVDVGLTRNSSTGVLDVSTPVGAKFDHGLSSWNHAPPTVQPTGGAATASAIWTATEQLMLQKLYDMARGAGHLS